MDCPSMFFLLSGYGLSPPYWERTDTSLYDR